MSFIEVKNKKGTTRKRPAIRLFQLAGFLGEEKGKESYYM
jgi:hypothetical protein